MLALHQAITGLGFLDAARDLNAVRDDDQTEQPYA
jgi:hypothetical protein